MAAVSAEAEMRRLQRRSAPVRHLLSGLLLAEAQAYKGVGREFGNMLYRHYIVGEVRVLQVLYYRGTCRYK